MPRQAIHSIGPFAGGTYRQYPQNVGTTQYHGQFIGGEERVSKHVLVLKQGDLGGEVFVGAGCVGFVGRVKDGAEGFGDVVGAGVAFAEDVNVGWWGVVVQLELMQSMDGGDIIVIINILLLVMLILTSVDNAEQSCGVPYLLDCECDCHYQC